MVVDPFPDTANGLAEAFAEGGQLVVDVRRDDRVDAARDETIALHLPERLGEHLLADPADLPAQLREANHAVLAEDIDDQKRPLVGDATEHLVHERFLLCFGPLSHSFSLVSMALSGAYFPDRLYGLRVPDMTNTSRSALRRLGSAGPTVFPIALGCMGMSGMYGAADEQESIATIHAAIDAGVTLLDTGDFYGMGHNELLIGRAIRDRRDRVLLSVKFGALRSPEGGWIGVDARPQAVKNFLAYTLTRLGVDHVDIYRPARLDPAVPIEETVGAIAELVKAGYVRHAGLSEVGAETIRRAQATHPIADLQIEYSLVSRGPETKILPLLAELGVGMTAYGVLSRGLLSGSKPTGPGDFRGYLPRFRGENRERNDRLVAALAALAAEKGVTATQLAIAWVLARDERIVPVIGARTRTQLDEALGALDIALSADDLARIEQAVSASDVAGTRYDEHQMRILDSER